MPETVAKLETEDRKMSIHIAKNKQFAFMVENTRGYEYPELASALIETVYNLDVSSAGVCAVLDAYEKDETNTADMSAETALFDCVEATKAEVKKDWKNPRGEDGYHVSFWRDKK